LVTEVIWWVVAFGVGREALVALAGVVLVLLAVVLLAAVLAVVVFAVAVLAAVFAVAVLAVAVLAAVFAVVVLAVVDFVATFFAGVAFAFAVALARLAGFAPSVAAGGSDGWCSALREPRPPSTRASLVATPVRSAICPAP
jgi:hypothetical protein